MEQLAQEVPTTALLEKAKTIPVTIDQWVGWVEKFLDTNHLLSSESSGTYHPDRPSSAADGKWQVVIRNDKTVLSINSVQKVIIVPGKSWNRTLDKAVVTLDHEMAHVIQAENRARIKLAIFDNVGLDRSSSYKEGGAVIWESEAYQQFFGHERPTTSNYHRAAAAILDGGSLRDAALAFFNNDRQRNPSNNLTKAAKEAVDRAMRFYRNSGIYSFNTPHLTNSQPLSYLEQELVAESLKGTKYEPLLFIANLNLQAALELESMGLFDLSEIHKPSHRPSQLIESEIHQLLNQSSTDTS
jgi:hypothetical protein